jgi:hypothetical protein
VSVSATGLVDHHTGTLGAFGLAIGLDGDHRIGHRGSDGREPVSSVTFEVVNACTVTSDLPSPSVKASGFPQPDPEQRERRAPQH